MRRSIFQNSINIFLFDVSTSFFWHMIGNFVRISIPFLFFNLGVNLGDKTHQICIPRHDYEIGQNDHLRRNIGKNAVNNTRISPILWKWDKKLGL